MGTSVSKRQAAAKPSDDLQKRFAERRKRANRDEPQDDQVEPMHRGSRSEVDDRWNPSATRSRS